MKRLVENLYSNVIENANRFLHHAKTLEMQFLRLKNPSYEEIATQLGKLADIICILAEEIGDPLTGQKSLDYVYHMKSIALAIKNNDEEALKKAAEELNRRSML